MTPRDLKRDVYVRIYLAAIEGRGLKLSADEVRTLGIADDAIYTAADQLLDKHGYYFVGTKIVKRKRDDS